MISWYISSKRTDDRYIDKVKLTVEPCMNYFCDRLSEVDDYDINDLNSLFREILEELPILNFQIDTNTNEFYFRYNKETDIKFNDPYKGIKRELILNKILN